VSAARSMSAAARLDPVTPLATAMRELVAHALQAVVTMDERGRITGWNAQAEELFGWTSGEVLGRPMHEVIIPERYRAAHRRGLERYRLSRRGPMIETRTDVSALHRDGNEFEVEISITALADSAGTTFVGFIRDLTERRRMTEALNDSTAQLQLAIAEREAIAASLRRLPPGRPANETALAICAELRRLPALDVAVVYEFMHDGSVVPIGQIVPPGVPTAPGRAVPPEHAAYLRASATGPWIDEWHRQPDDDEFRRAWMDAGLECSAFVPFGADGITYGLLSAGTTSAIGSAGVARWLPSLTEFGTIAAALLMPELSERRERAGARAEIASLIAANDLTTVFHPVVRLSDRSVVGYEALTRFADGTPPERRFAAAESVGAGRELESAAMQAALHSAMQLPRGCWVSVNLSPSRLTEPDVFDLLRKRHGRTLVVEVTERLAIDDYASVRATLDRLPGRIEVAVDDAGAGFASLRHILELRPRYVKLDMQLVRGVDSDPARQALIAGMVYFARQSDCLLVAEGIETEEERLALRLLGVPFGQGYLFGRPAAAEAWAEIERAEATIRSRQPRAATRAARLGDATG
jgi:PAS domain S-box-containing protein